MIDLDKKIKTLSLKQGAIKILINSIYGAFGNKWFYFYNPDIAQSITLQGQDLIKFSIKAINFYFKERWHLDTELHQILGVADRIISKIEDEAAIYTDTDSIYVQFDSALKSIEGLNLSTDECLQMCIKIDEHRLAGYFDQCFDKWSKVFNTDNRQTFKLELIAENGFWIKKKNYALKVSYEPNPSRSLYSKDERYLLIKGLEPIKSSYPIWARNHQLRFIEYLLKIGNQVKLEEELIPMISEVFKEFLTLKPDEVAMNFNIRQYDKYVDNETKGTLKKGATPYPKAVMHHNHLVIKNKLESRYQRLREGGKVKFIHCKYNPDLDVDVFAYRPGDYPIEIAPEIDLIQHFFILIVEPINRVLGAIGVNQIDKHLKRAVEFKTSKSKNPLTKEQLYPLHVIDSETLAHEEVPEKFWEIIENPDAKIPDEIYGEYLSIITKYGLNTVVLINKNLKPYINRISKNKKLNGDV
jgi:DNA polymerase elongation subunit (family B)